MKNFFLVLILLLDVALAGCKHTQELHYSDENFVPKDTLEKDPKKQILEAVTLGDLDRIQKLISEGVDVNTQNVDGQTLLIMSVENQRYAVIDLLMSLGADPEIKDKLEKTAYDYASGVILNLLNREELSSERLSELLVLEGVGLRKADLVAWLLGKGADPNALINRKTPLITACAQQVQGEELNQLYRVVKNLATHPDIDFTIEVRRKTALDIAKMNNYLKIVDLLISLGAK